MAVKTTGEYKILGMLTQISDEEFGRWGNQAPLIRSEILKCVMSGPQKIKGIDLEVTDLFTVHPKLIVMWCAMLPSKLMFLTMSR